MLTERIFIDKIEVLEDGQIQVRRATAVMRDGEEITRTYHREVLDPAVGSTHTDPRVQAVVSAIWTPSVVKARKDFVSAQQDGKQ